MSAKESGRAGPGPAGEEQGTAWGARGRPVVSAASDLTPGLRESIWPPPPWPRVCTVCASCMFEEHPCCFELPGLSWLMEGAVADGEGPTPRPPLRPDSGTPKKSFNFPEPIPQVVQARFPSASGARCGLTWSLLFSCHCPHLIPVPRELQPAVFPGRSRSRVKGRAAASSSRSDRCAASTASPRSACPVPQPQRSAAQGGGS